MSVEIQEDQFSVAAVDYRSADAPARFTDSLRRTGFGVLRHHPIPRELLEQIHGEWLAFFSGDAKNAYATEAGQYDGYISSAKAETAVTYDRQDLKEYFHFFSWGRYPAEVSDAARRYFDQAASLAQELL